MPTSDDERGRVMRAIQGDAVAFGELKDRYGSVVHAVLLARVPPQVASELTEEVLERAAKNIRSVPEPGAIGGWFADLARRRAGQVPAAEQGGGAVLRSLGALPEADREAVLMQLAEGLGNREIARATGRTVAEVEEAHRRGIETMGDEKPRLESMLRALRWAPPPGEEDERKKSPLRFIVPVVVVLALIALGAIFALRPKDESGPRITWTAGQTGTLAFAVGDALETEAGERARVTLEEGLSLEVEAYSALTLEASQPENHHHHLDLARGLIHTEIASHSHSLVIKAGTVTVMADDPGRFTLDVNDEGAGEVQVSTGGVKLGGGEQSVVYVPAGARCSFTAAVGPGVPYFDDAIPELRGVKPEGNAALAAAFAATREKDTLTLFHLLPRVDETAREMVVVRLTELVPLPAGVDLASLSALDEKALKAYAETLRPHWQP